MSYRKMKLENERRDEIRRLDACVLELRALIAQLEDAIRINAGQQEWAVAALKSGGDHREKNV
jgi:5-enolpyruvylshikimate-3-phosphate synthase